MFGAGAHLEGANLQKVRGRFTLTFIDPITRKSLALPISRVSVLPETSAAASTEPDSLSARPRIPNHLRAHSSIRDQKLSVSRGCALACFPFGALRVLSVEQTPLSVEQTPLCDAALGHCDRRDFRGRVDGLGRSE
eukprot:3080739-Pleurochrysis_carterae.AAC.1